MVITGTEVLVSGPGISLTEMETLRSYRPQWPSDPQSDIIQTYMYDERSPTVVYVYPPASSNAYVEIIYVKEPTDCATTGDSISLPDNYANVLLNLILARAHEKDIEGGNPARAQYYYKLAADELGLKSTNELRGSPNLRSQDGVPPRVGK